MRWLAQAISSAVVAAMVACVRAYQVVLSPLIGDCCRFRPSCSNYCIEALKVHGPFYGSWLTIRRLCRCRPFGPSGYDPVPPKKTRTFDI